MSTIEVIAAVITAYSIWLATKENIYYWPTGIISLSLYLWTYFRARLYGMALLQATLLIVMIYGWYEWLHGGRHRTELSVSWTPRRAWPFLLGAGIAGTAIAVPLMRRYTDNPAPLIDSSLMAFSFVAQFMTARKWIESWLFWVVINIVSVYLFFGQRLYVTTVLYVALLLLAIDGYRKWKRSFASA